ncbi:MAG: aldo/keto reductase [Planctomycetales bacterium]|nr:aldo/keto reductase [bacterium]UNM08729.1 MAG: aldo/keto reductase [Planctomycetales bacterium]
MSKIPALDNYRLLGNSGLAVSPLCLGTMTFGTEWGFGGDRENSRKLFEVYTEAGGNFLDTAINYNKGTSEEYLGEFVKGSRERYVIATKFTFGTREGDPNSGGNHRKNIIQSVDESLKRLGLEYIDLYWLHVWEYRTPVEELMRAIDDLVRMGKILYFGFSDTPAWVVSRANAVAELRGWTPAVAVQMEHSLIERTYEAEMLTMARHLNIAVTPWSPLGAGVLTGKYLGNEEGEGEGTRSGAVNRSGKLNERNTAIVQAVVDMAQQCGKSPAQVALNWLLCQPGVTAPIIGARTPEQLSDNLGSCGWRLDDEQLAKLNEVSAVDQPFPHSFIHNPRVQAAISAQTNVESRLPE